MKLEVETSIPILFEKTDEVVDGRFTKVKIWICSIGENLNGSYFDKPLVESMIPSLSNIPILGYISKNSLNEADFNGHEEILVIEENGVKVEYIGRAYGLIPETNDATFETKKVNGKDIEFLVCTGILWNKFQECIDIFDRDLVKSQSLELFPDSIKGEFREDKLFHFTSATFEGACILGENVTAAMTGSVVEKFTESTIKDEVRALIAEYSHFTKNITNESIEGGERMKSTVNKKEIAAKFSLTVNQLYTELDRALSTITYISENYYGDPVERSKYYINDYDETYCYAYDCELRMDMKIPYVMNGDNPEIDIENASRIKYVPSDWVVETEGSVEDLDELDEFDTYAKKVIDEAKVEFTTLKKSFEDKFAIKDESYLKLTEKFELLQAESIKYEDSIKSLQQYKDENESAKNKVEVETLFTKYSKHLSKEEMENLRESYKTFTKFSDYVNHFNSIVVNKLIVDEKPNFSRMSINLDTDLEQEDKSKSTSAYKKVKNKKYN